MPTAVATIYLHKKYNKCQMYVYIERIHTHRHRL